WCAVSQSLNPPCTAAFVLPSGGRPPLLPLAWSFPSKCAVSSGPLDNPPWNLDQSPPDPDVPHPAGSLQGLPLRFVAPQISLYRGSIVSVGVSDASDLSVLMAVVVRFFVPRGLNIRFLSNASGIDPHPFSQRRLFPTTV
ncbi:MAG: hypothetical protein J07HQX50_01790, partial [Haloquadratum sp. J07HQX50]